MAVKVLITRRFKPDAMKKSYQLLMELRSLATLQTGYVSGQTLLSVANPSKLTVVSTWVSAKRWDEWHDSPKRKEFSKRIEPLLEAPEEVEVFMVGEKTPEWVDMA
ncbi:MAG: antibiotic biosynthesis monooxygenase [Desulfomonilaceae bacterium]